MESNNSMGGTDQTYNPTSSNPVSDNPSASKTSPEGKTQVKTISLSSRLVDGISGGILIVAGLTVCLLYLRKRLVGQMATAGFSLGVPEELKSRLTAGTIISPDNPDHKEDNHE